MSDKLLHELEEKIVCKTVQALLDAGYVLQVKDDWDTIDIEDTSQKALEELFAYDDVLLIARHPVQRNGWVRFVYGNDGWDVINDYSTTLESVLEPVLNFAEQYA